MRLHLAGEMNGELRSHPETLLTDMGWVFRLARSLVADAATAEDVTQETWIAALQRDPASGPPPRRWLAAVARNFARQRARSEASRASRERRVAADEPLPGPDQLATRMENQRVLAEAVTRLSEPYRSTVILRFSDDLAPKEIARRMQVPDGTVRRRLKEGLDRLRADLDRRYGDQGESWVAALLPLVHSQRWLTTGPTFLGGFLTMKTLAISLVACICAVGLFLTFRASGALEKPASAPLTAEGSTAALDDVDVQPLGAEGAEASNTRRADAALGAQRADEILEVAGTLVLPRDYPDDPTLEVFVARAALDYIDLVDLLPDEDERWGDPDATLFDRVEVGPDAAFLVRFPASWERGYLLARGRFLYTASAHTVDLAAGEREVALTPDVGSWIRGRLLSPGGTGSERDGDVDGIELRIGAHAELEPSAALDWHVFETSVDSQADGSFEFRGVPSEQGYVLFALPEKLAAKRTEIAGLAPLRVAHVEMQLGWGAQVSGIVLDANRDPVPGALVEAKIPGTIFGFDDRAVRSDTSAPDGSFELPVVPAGEIVLRASSEGMLESERTVVEVPRAARPGTARLDDVELQLAVGRTVAGRVTWEDGRPAANVYVRVEFDLSHRLGANSFRSLRGESSHAVSDERGLFRATGLGAGPFTATAEKWVENDRTEESVRHRGQVDGVAPDVEDLELVLRPPLFVEGRVVDAKDAPVERFRVHAARVVDGGVGPMAMERRVESFSSADGRFRVTELGEGRWSLTAEAEGFVTPEPTYVDVPVGANTEIVLRGVLSVTVAGRVLDSDGMPAAGARVYADTGLPSWTHLFDPRSRVPSTVSNTAGEFRLSGLTPGSLTVVADARTKAPSLPLSVELPPGEVAEGVELELRDGGTLEVQVLGEQGAPAGGFVVHAEHTFSGEVEFLNTDGEGQVRFENMIPGEWSIAALDARQDWSQADEDGNVWEPLTSMHMTVAEIREGETTEVVLGQPGDAPVRIFGSVTRAGEPYKGGWISFTPAHGGGLSDMAFGIVDVRGNYEVKVKRPGTYNVGVQMFRGGLEDQSSIDFLRDVPAVDECEFHFELPTAGISGHVFDSGGEPIVGARVTLMGEGRDYEDEFHSGDYVEVVTDEEGGYDFPSLRDGTYHVAAGGLSYDPEVETYARALHGDLLLGEDEQMTGVDFQLQPTAALTVEVVAEDGSSVAGATVFARHAEGFAMNPLSAQVTDAAGKCTFVGLGDGSYSFFARTSDRASDESVLTEIDRGGDARVRLTLLSGTRLRLHLRDASGAPAVGWFKVLDSDGNDAGSAYAAAEIMTLFQAGAFSPSSPLYGPLPPGEYTVEAQSFEGGEISQRVVLAGEDEIEIVLSPSSPGE